MEFNLVKTNTSTGFQRRGVLFKYKGQKKDNSFISQKLLQTFYIIDEASKNFFSLDTKEAVLLISLTTHLYKNKENFIATNSVCLLFHYIRLGNVSP